MKLKFVGGLNEQQYPSLEEAAVGSQNFDLQKSQLQFIPRRPFDLEGTAPNGSSIGGIMQLVKRDNSETTIVQAGKDIYTWSGENTSSGWAIEGSVNANSKLRDIHWLLDEWLIITDIELDTPVSRWDGSVFGALPTGLGGTLYAKYAAVYNNRVWFSNIIIGSTPYPQVILASAFENATSYDSTKRAKDSSFTTGLEAFFLVSPDLRPINGMQTFYNTLVFSTVDGAMFRMSGSTSEDYTIDPFYAKSNAAGTETMINAGNDLFFMRQGGAIESLISTQNFGDVATDDVSRYIPDSIDGLTDGIAAYDQVLQKVMWFVGSKVLVLFKDFLETKLSPWSIYKTQLSESFNTNAVKYMKRPGTQEYTVYFGGANGQIFNLNGSGTSGDAGSYAIQSKRVFRWLDKDDGLNWGSVFRGRIQYRRKGTVPISVEGQWGDEFYTSTCSMNLDGDVSTTSVYFGGSYYFGGSIYFNQGADAVENIATKGFSLVGKGSTLSLSLSAESTVRFQIDHIMV
jgi:hypothetical protein